ncbi:phosphate transport system protein [Lysinibacillus composti]|uniref:Phosphate-specific transport system accessory protein PhoU n=1 Tax=Lysinibacillus composti TaxID=720633 RepID=A0A3N9UK36_9BACI|nr:phosphate signaling complex protein PhoU [Lysinibacillus composti]MBM7607101.1 phosphate transport system protein [Lysinibacillus composti]RQW76307.1 phosphate signaling complex protein PhoU [Lysinibacillus composti]
MGVRGRYEHDIEDVQNELIKLCKLSISQLDLTFKSFINKDLKLAREIINKDTEINHLEELINDRVILIMTRQQPVAKDLRRLVVLLKAASDMERVGDYAVNIAKETIRIGDSQFITSVELIEDMFLKTSAMLNQVVEAFVEENTTKAKEVADFDDQIDEMYGSMITQLMKLSSVRPENISQITNLAFICRFIERCADLATNIAEYLFYLKKGQRFDLNN